MTHNDPFSWKRDFLPIWLGQFLVTTGLGVIAPFLALYIQEMGVVDPVQVRLWTGAMASGLAWATAVMSPIWGPLTDRYGRKLMVLRAIFGISLILFLLGFATSVWQVFALRVLQGVLTGTLQATTVLTVVTVPRERVGSFLGLLQTAVFAGTGVGPVLGGWIAGQWGYRPAAFAGAGLALAATLIVLIWTHDRPISRPTSARLSLAGLGKDLTRTLSHPAILSLAVVILLVRVATSFSSSLVPLYIQELAKRSPAGLSGLVGAATSAGAVTSALGAILVGRFADRRGAGRVAFYCALGIAILSLPQAFVGNPWQLLVFLAGAGFFAGGLMPTLDALISSRLRAGQEGSAFGTTYMTTSIGQAIGPLLGSGLASAWNIPGAFGVTALLCGLVAGWIGLRLLRPAEPTAG